MDNRKESSYTEIPCTTGCEKCELCSKIDEITHSHINEKVNSRIRDFREIDKANRDVLFCELCFCILTANFNAVRAIKIQEELGKEFITLTQEDLAKRLKQVGYRFPNTRAQYIFESRKWYENLEEILSSYSKQEQRKLRNWLAKNVKGLGFKEASHFLRNIGYDDCAIIDFHIVGIYCEVTTHIL
jgi:N-glycosylase/DNA lyase